MQRFLATGHVSEPLFVDEIDASNSIRIVIRGDAAAAGTSHGSETYNLGTGLCRLRSTRILHSLSGLESRRCGHLASGAFMNDKV